MPFDAAGWDGLGDFHERRIESMAVNYLSDVSDQTHITIAEMVPARNVIEDSGVVAVVV